LSTASRLGFRRALGARAARHPGQVCGVPEAVSRDDESAAPESDRPSNGLIGCVSARRKELLATAWEPYQSCSRVIVCLHSDFRIGGLKPGQSKTIRGKIYLMPADFVELRQRYRKDFPEQEGRGVRDKAGSPAKKLIEFGWDEPGTSFLRRHRAELERTPFDGCVFHIERGTATGLSELHLARWSRRPFSRIARAATWRQSGRGFATISFGSM
jgi:hypothetical protein